jgi:pyridoxamine 5'-phosphate oxidase
MRMSDPALDAFVDHAWAMLVRGAADKRSALNTPAFATVATDGAPDVRTVVLRQVDRTRRTLTIYTDARSAKVAALRKTPTAALLFHDPKSRLQIRVSGTADVHTGDTVAAQGWARTPPGSRTLYAQAVAPGRTIMTPTAAHAPNEMSRDDDGAAAFTVVIVTVARLDVLELAREGHRRAVSDAAGTRWVAP